MRKLKILCSISARGGSKGIPRKNLKLLNGRPLLSYAIETALQSKLIDKVIVNTEDEEIADIAKKYGAEVPFVRSKELALDHITLTEVSKNSMNEMDKLGHKFDAILQLAPTCPFIESGSIDKVIQIMLEKDCDSVLSLKVIEHEHPYRAKELSDNGEVSPFLKDINVESFKQRQDLPVLYCSSGALYLRKRKILHNWSGNDMCLGNSVQGLVLDDVQSINIDRPIDFKFSEFMMSEKKIN